ncbi:phage major capsid protein [Bacillus paranthracis]|uniref:phage major capsid protein n=1 Tax=Bacillus paranthracis TaxID=2026186 RepID=UPI003F6C131D
MNEKIEQRSFSLSEVNQSSDGFFVRGLVNPTGEWSQTLYDKHGNPFIERVMPSVFENALKRGNDVKLLLEHDKNMLLARTKDETLKLTETSRGLEMEANLVPSNQSEHIHALIKRGTLNNMSFGMVVLDAEWEKEKGVNKRSITELALYECSIVSDPAYTQSTVEARSQNIIEDVEVPNLTERNYPNMKFETMTSKQLEERKQELLSEANEIEESKATEKRSFTPSEQLRQEAILNEIRTINEQIDFKNKTQRNGEFTMENTLTTKEQEIRGVEQFLRRQDGEEIRTMVTGSEPGKLLIPTSISNHIVEKLRESAPIFALTRNFTPVAGFLEILREDTIGSAGFVGEMEELELSEFSMNKIRLDQKRVGTYMELSNQLINDSGIDIIGYSTRILSRRLGLTIDASVLRGDKATQFEGILNDDITIKPQEALASNAITIEELLDLHNSMHPAYMKGSVWVMGRQAFNMIAKLKDNNGHFYLVKDVAETGVTYKLFGQPVLINDAMPKPEAGQKAVLFVNFDEGYATMTKKGMNFKLIDADRANALKGITTLMLDAYMDGKILNPNAIKVLKMKSA